MSSSSTPPPPPLPRSSFVRQMRNFCFIIPSSQHRPTRPKIECKYRFSFILTYTIACNIRIAFISKSKENKLNTRWLPKNWWINLHIWHRPIFGLIIVGSQYQALYLLCFIVVVVAAAGADADDDAHKIVNGVKDIPFKQWNKPTREREVERRKATSDFASIWLVINS